MATESSSVDKLYEPHNLILQNTTQTIHVRSSFIVALKPYITALEAYFPDMFACRLCTREAVGEDLIDRYVYQVLRKDPEVLLGSDIFTILRNDLELNQKRVEEFYNVAMGYASLILAPVAKMLITQFNWGIQHLGYERVWIYFGDVNRGY